MRRSRMDRRTFLAQTAGSLATTWKAVTAAEVQKAVGA